MSSINTNVQRVLDNWNDYRKVAAKADECEDVETSISMESLAEAYFMGAWTAFKDDDIVEMLDRMNREELGVIMNYKIWM